MADVGQKSMVMLSIGCRYQSLSFFRFVFSEIVENTVQRALDNQCKNPGVFFFQPIRNETNHRDSPYALFPAFCTGWLFLPCFLIGWLGFYISFDWPLILTDVYENDVKTYPIPTQRAQFLCNSSQNSPYKILNFPKVFGLKPKVNTVPGKLRFIGSLWMGNLIIELH